MGASTFTEIGRGADVRAAFRAASERAGHENGHGYSGSLAEKSSFIVVSHSLRQDEESAVEYALNMVNADDPRVSDKWGPAGAVQFKDPKAPAGEETWLFFGWASC